MIRNCKKFNVPLLSIIITLNLTRRVIGLPSRGHVVGSPLRAHAIGSPSVRVRSTHPSVCVRSARSRSALCGRSLLRARVVGLLLSAPVGGSLLRAGARRSARAGLACPRACGRSSARPVAAPYACGRLAAQRAVRSLLRVRVVGPRVGSACRSALRTRSASACRSARGLACRSAWSACRVRGVAAPRAVGLSLRALSACQGRRSSR